MTIEFIIYFSIVIIFVILVRHIPSAINKEKQVELVKNHNAQKFNFLQRFNQFSVAPQQQLNSTDKILGQAQDNNFEAKEVTVAQLAQEQSIPANHEHQVAEANNLSQEKEKKLDDFFGPASNDLELGSLIKRDESITKVDFVPKHTPSPDLSKINSSVPPNVHKEGVFDKFKDFFINKTEKNKQVNLSDNVNQSSDSQKNHLTEKSLNPEQQNVLDGDRFFAEGNLEAAEQCYLKSVIINPRNPKIYNRLGAIYLKNKNFKEALESFEAARDLDGAIASRHYNVALAAYESKNLAKARQAIDEALRLDPGSISYYQLRDLIANSK